MGCRHFAYFLSEKSIKCSKGWESSGIENEILKLASGVHGVNENKMDFERCAEIEDWRFWYLIGPHVFVIMF